MPLSNSLHPRAPRFVVGAPALLLLLLAAAPALAVVATPSPPELSARGYLLVDFDSGRVLASKNPDQALEPASLTKIMTAYVLFHEITSGKVDPAQEVVISEKAWRTGGSRMFIEVGKKVTVDDLLKGMVIQSGNDASVALAEHVAGAEEAFAELMNAHARRLGMRNTHFTNSTGLPDEELYTTVADMALLAAAMIREFPEMYKLYAVKEFTFNEIKQHNRNRLLWRDDSVDGIKTGHTQAAGYCLVASAKRDGMRLISVIMGTDSENTRARESQALLNYGFRFFETRRLYGPGAEVTRSRVWKGAQEQLSVGVNRALFITVPAGAYDQVKAEQRIEGRLTAPLQQGEKVGELRLSLEGEALEETDLLALESVPEGSLWQQAKDAVLLWLE